LRKTETEKEKKEMSKKDSGLIISLINAFNKIADELETTNSYLFGIGGELAQHNETLEAINSRLEFIAVTLDSLTEKPAEPEKAEAPQETYRPVM